MDMQKDLQRYLCFLKERGFRYETNEVLEIIDDINMLVDYSKAHGVKLGIIYESPFHIFVVDLVRNKAGKLFPCERLVKTAVGNSVVVVPFREGKIILLKQFRHALGDYQYCFPRGFGEPDISPEENARKEIGEELNCTSSDYVFLGNTVADSGVCGEKICVFCCNVDEPTVNVLDENIESYIAVTDSELLEMIGQGKINDGFTLSAVALMKGKEHFS